jgi:hypothetical protein
MVWFVRILFGLVLLIVYLTISAEGMRYLFETASMPLYKTGLWPLTYFGRIAEFRKVDLAHLLSLALMVVVWIAWEMIVRIYAHDLELTNERRIIWAAGTAVLICDLTLFWLGISNSSFFAGSSVFSATVITAMYAGMLILVATWVNMLEQRRAT